MTALVTIGIPNYNGARWLSACVESALGQDWPAKEVIVVDDGSTDGSRDVLRSFGDRIVVVPQEHLGANHARNEILRRARGEWIQFLDADDYLVRAKISRQLAEAGSGDGDVLYGPVLVEEGGGQRVSALDAKADVCAQWIAWELPQTGGCLWKKTALSRLGGWNEQMPCCQEHELYLRAIKDGFAFRYTPTANAVYRIWSDTTLCRRDPRQVVHLRTALLDDLRAWMSARELWTMRHQLLAGRACFEMARTLAKYDLEEARAYHHERQAVGLMDLAGPAAPARYRLSYRLLGFVNSERLARVLR